MDDAEARAILREHGEEPPVKGKLGPQWFARAESLRADAPPMGEGITEADFGPDVSVAEPPPELPAERPPRRPQRERKSLRDRVTEARGTGKGKGRAKKKHPRVSVAPLIGNFWGIMGGVVTRIDAPVGMCLQMQAPVAGYIMEDVVKDTFADRALQPIARAEARAEKVGALILPPLCVAGIEAAQRLPEPQRKTREAILYPMLVESLVLAERVTGDLMDKVAEDIQRDGPARERAEMRARLIFGDVPEPEPAAA